MKDTGTSSNHSNDNDNQKGDSHNPDVVPPDYDRHKRAAQEKGRGLREAILKGGVSGAVRFILEQGWEHL